MDAVTMAFGGKTKEQKAVEAQQKKTELDALQRKVGAIQGDVGSRTRDLVARYGVAGRPSL